MTQASDVVDFWRAAGPERWYAKDAAFDEAIRARFEAAHHAAARGELDGWAEAPESALALLLLLDQVPRNIYRGSAHAFATDPLARLHARQAVERGHDQATELALREFVYMPFEHSEDLADQACGVALFEALDVANGKPPAAEWARKHQGIVERFGRFPHRNRALGRTTTAEEQAFLGGGGFAG